MTDVVNFFCEATDTTDESPLAAAAAAASAAPLAKFPASFVLDCEVCAVDSSTGKLLPMQRMGAVGTSTCIFAFDLLVCNGESLVGLPLR